MRELQNPDYHYDSPNARMEAICYASSRIGNEAQSPYKSECRFEFEVEISFTFQQASGCSWLRIARLACLVSRHRAWQAPWFGAWPRAAACAKLMARTSSWLKIAARALHGASVSNPNTPRLPMLTTSSLAKSHTGLEIAG